MFGFYENPNLERDFPDEYQNMLKVLDEEAKEEEQYWLDKWLEDSKPCPHQFNELPF